MRERERGRGREGNCRRCFASINYNFCAPHVRFQSSLPPSLPRAAALAKRTRAGNLRLPSTSARYVALTNVPSSGVQSVRKIRAQMTSRVFPREFRVASAISNQASIGGTIELTQYAQSRRSLSIPRSTASLLNFGSGFTRGIFYTRARVERGEACGFLDSRKREREWLKDVHDSVARIIHVFAFHAARVAQFASAYNPADARISLRALVPLNFRPRRTLLDSITVIALIYKPAIQEYDQERGLVRQSFRETNAARPANIACDTGSAPMRDRASAYAVNCRLPPSGNEPFSSERRRDAEIRMGVSSACPYNRHYWFL